MRATKPSAQQEATDKEQGMEAAMDAHMRRISKETRTSTEEERRLAEAIHGSDREASERAVERLVTANLRLVVKIAHDFKGSGLEFDDLVAEGNVGIVVAARRFSPDLCPRFSCYAAWWIKQAMRKAINRTSRTIRIPEEAYARLRRVRAARATLWSSLGRAPNATELAEESGLTEQSVRDIERAATDVMELDASMDDDGRTYAETVADESVSTRESSEPLLEAVAALDDLSRTLVECVYGLGRRPVPLREAAQLVGMSLASAEHTMSRVLASLRDRLTDRL